MDFRDRFDGKSASLDGAESRSGVAPAASRAAACGIAFMAKASQPGRAKTRLVPPLTYDEAAALNTAFLQDVADNLLDAARDARSDASVAGFAAYGPPGSEG